MIIGVCGESCVGKTTYVKNNFQQELVINLDYFAKEVIMNHIDVTNFLVQKQLNQDELRKALFNDFELLKELNVITFPLFERALKQIIVENSSKNIVIEGFIVPMLTKIDFDQIIELKANFIKKLFRLKKRDQSSFCSSIKLLRIQKKLLKEWVEV